MSNYMCQKMFHLASAFKPSVLMNRLGPSMITRGLSGTTPCKMEFENDELKDDLQEDELSLNQVLLVGAVCSQPYALQRMGDVFGYSVNLCTHNTFTTKNGRIRQKTYHDVVCFRRDLLPLCQDLTVGDRVLIQGNLVNKFAHGQYEDRHDGERNKVEIKAAVMEKLA